MNDREWFEYLERLPSGVKGIVPKIWQSLPALPAPTQAGPSEDGLAYSLVWDEGFRLFEVEIEEDYAWLYRDRESSIHAGGEVATVDALVVLLERYVLSSGGRDEFREEAST